MNNSEKIAKIKELIENTEFTLIEDAAHCLIEIIKIAYK
jgi:dihydroneopterin aldolase